MSRARQFGIVADTGRRAAVRPDPRRPAGRMPDDRPARAHARGLRTLALSEAALQRDMLRTRAGLLRNYDPIVGAVDGSRPRRRVPAGGLRRMRPATRGWRSNEGARDVAAAVEPAGGARRAVQVAERACCGTRSPTSATSAGTTRAGRRWHRALPNACSASPAAKAPKPPDVTAALDRLVARARRCARAQHPLARARTPYRRDPSRR